METLFTLAEEAMKKNKWSEALIRWQTILFELDDKTPARVYVQMGRAYREQGILSQAEELLAVGMIKHPEHVAIFIEYAECAMKSESWEDAVSRWTDIKKKFKEFPCGVYVRLARALLNLYQFSAAAEQIDECLKDYPNYEKALDFLNVINSAKSAIYSVSTAKLNKDLRSAFDSKPGLYSCDFLINFEIKGWFEVKTGVDAQLTVETFDERVTVYPLNKKRPDVLASLVMHSDSMYDERCGFLYHFNIFDIKRIGVKYEDKIYWIYSLEVERIHQVLKGKEGWLFLENDSNHSVDLYTGKLLLSDSELGDWNSYFSHLSKFQESNKCIFIIAPSKESVLPQFYPYQRGGRIITDQLRELTSFRRVKTLFPLELMQNTQGTYCKTDTHWSCYGAFLCLSECMRQFGIADHLDNIFNFQKSPTVGDLGSKVIPPATDLELKSSNIEASTANLLFYNHIQTTGSIIIYINKGAPIKGKIVIFGDSFSTKLLSLMKEIFYRVVRIYSPASPITEVVDYERPDYVILQTNERFLKKPPTFITGLCDSTVKSKINTLSLEEKKILKAKLINEKHTEEFYVEYMLKELDMQCLKSFQRR